MSTKVKTFTGSGTFDVRSEMLKDTSDMLDNVEITDIAQQCVLLKEKEDEIAELEDKLKAKKAEADDISSRVIPELLQEQGLSEIKLGKDSLTVFSNTLHLDQNVIVKIKATDIIISTIIPDKLSSLNYLKTNIEEVVFQEGLACLILNYENNTIKALLTKKSFRKLNIKKGMQCYAIIKALNINDVTNVNIV